MRARIFMVGVAMAALTVADVAMGFFFIQAPWAFSGNGQQQSLLPIGMWTVGLLAGACLAAGDSPRPCTPTPRRRQRRPAADMTRPARAAQQAPRQLFTGLAKGGHTC